MPWGWIEWFIIAQTFLPGLLFIPGLSQVPAFRTSTRIASYLIALVAWIWISQRNSSQRRVAPLPARGWLILCSIWLVMQLAHPNNYSTVTAFAQVMMYITVLSPVFWAGDAMGPPRQLTRIMAILFLCNAFSATLGLAQAFSDRFNPPVIPVMSNEYGGDNFRIELADGRKMFRPCGLSDSPGAAAPAGATAALIGLCFALRPIGLFRRAACVVLAFIGITVIYYTQIRSTLVVLAICVLVITVMMIIRGRTGEALTLAFASAGMSIGALYWVARRMGSGVLERFRTLVDSDTGDLYRRSRGGFVWEALTRTVWENPLGHGLGWWGMIHSTFRNPTRYSTVWVEVMIPAWVIDGGFPLLILYMGAVIVTILDSLRIALKSKDPDVSAWAPLVVALNISTLALSFSFVTFVTPIGQQFWLLNTVLHVADAQARSRGERPATVQPARRRRIPRPWPMPPGPVAG